MAAVETEEKIRPQGQEEPVITSRETEPGKTPPGIQEHLQKIEREPAKEPVTDDSTGQTVLSPTGSIPLTEEQAKRGMKAKIADSLRWLAEFSLRMIKKTTALGKKT